MAVTQNSEIQSKQPVEEGERVGPEHRDGADAGPSGNPSRFSGNGTKGGDGDTDKDTCGVAKRSKRRRRLTRDDIDDAEVCGYLNTKEEMIIKKILWEAMNGDYTKAKKQKRATKVKKDDSVKKAAKTTDKVKSQRPSSRIDYDALKRLNVESEQTSEATQVAGADSNENNYNEDEDGIIDGTDYRNFDHDENMYNEYGDDGDYYFDF